MLFFPAMKSLITQKVLIQRNPGKKKEKEILKKCIKKILNRSFVTILVNIFEVSEKKGVDYKKFTASN